MYALANAFSLNMLPSNNEGKLSIREIEMIDARCIIDGRFTSFIGHQSTASLLSYMFNEDIEVNRSSFEFTLAFDRLLVAQYSGPRLEEGATTLPENANFRFFDIHYEFNVLTIDKSIEEYMAEMPELLQDTLLDLGVYEIGANTFYVKDVNNNHYRVSYRYNDRSVSEGNLVTSYEQVL